MNPIVIDRWSDGENKCFTVELGCMKCDVKAVKQPIEDYIYVMQCENGKEVYENDSSIGIRNIKSSEETNVINAVRKIIRAERRN